MLKSLYISNYALINELHIDFREGMTVLTGETGAGKSIIIGALSLVMGQRADVKVIKEGEQKAVVEIHFDIKDYNLQTFFEENQLDYVENTIVRREVIANGKSRAFINDTPVQLTMLRELSDKLIDIHSQHENLLLATDDYQLQVVDSIAANEKEQTNYWKVFEEWKSAKNYLLQLRKEADKQGEDLDYLQFQLSQLDEADLMEGEQEELEAELETLSHVEEIKRELQTAEFLIESEESNVLSAIKDTVSAVRKISGYITGGEVLMERLEASLIEFKDIASEIALHQQRIDFNPERLEFVDNRLGTLYALQKKFKTSTMEELILLRENCREQLNRIGNMDEELATAEKQLKKCKENLKAEAVKLTDSRIQAIPYIENHLIDTLMSLGMPDIQFKVRVKQTDEFIQSGIDLITFLFSANKNRSLQPVVEIASGGEVSRVMLAIKSMLVSKAELPTIIFDEIDTGVSGDIAGRMGDIMQIISKNSQVIVITHLPQIAAKGSDHFNVYKDSSGIDTQTYIKRLTLDERIREIAQMVSGKQVTEAALMNARELMEIADSKK